VLGAGLVEAAAACNEAGTGTQVSIDPCCSIGGTPGPFVLMPPAISIGALTLSSLTMPKFTKPVPLGP
jgi:hypothetical protein